MKDFEVFPKYQEYAAVGSFIRELIAAEVGGNVFMLLLLKDISYIVRESTGVRLLIQWGDVLRYCFLT